MAPFVIPLAIAAAGLIAGAIQNRQNRKAQQKQNEQDREFQRQMFDTQVKEARQDFDTTNAYNHPLQQVQRMREGGLNPHLAYDNGATTTAAMVKNYNPIASNQPAPQSDLSYIGSSLSNGITVANQLYQGRQIQAQTSALEEQSRLMVKEGLLKDAQTAETITKNATGKFELEKARELKDSVVTRAKLENDAIMTNMESQRIGNSIALSRLDIDRLNSSVNRAKTWQDILASKMAMTKVPAEIEHLKQMIAVAKQEEKLKAFDNSLRQMNIHPGDPWYVARMQQFLSQDAPGIHERFKAGSKSVNESIQDFFEKQGFKIDRKDW